MNCSSCPTMCLRLAAAFSLFLIPTSHLLAQDAEAATQAKPGAESSDKDDSIQVATFGGGCFWCVESVFEFVDGVETVVSGYSGDDRPQFANPSYELVCTKKTRHAEVCQIKFDSEVVSYQELLEIFFKTHDPTKKDRQGPDKGPQYRSIIFTHSDEQFQIANDYIKKLNDEKAYGGTKRVLTEVEAIGEFFEAEEYHQDFFMKNPQNTYCRINAAPKLLKLKKEFGDKLKQ